MPAAAFTAAARLAGGPLGRRHGWGRAGEAGWRLGLGAAPSPSREATQAAWSAPKEINLALLDLDYALNNDAPKEPQQDAENYEAFLKEYNGKRLYGSHQIVSAS